MGDGGSTVVEILLALIAGGALTAIATFGTRRAEFRREDRLRWLADRRDSYARVIDRLTEMCSEALMLALHVRTPGLEETRRRRSEAALDRFTDAMPDQATLRLLAPRDVVRHLDRLEDAAADLWRQTMIGSFESASNADDIEHARTRLLEEIAAFTQAARKDIRA